MSVLEEFQKRRELLFNLRYKDAQVRLKGFLNFCESQPKIRNIIQKHLADHPVGHLIADANENNPPKAESREQIVSIGLHLMSECKYGKELYDVAVQLGIAEWGASNRFQDYVDDAMEGFINPALDYVEHKLEELVEGEQKGHLKYGEGKYGEGVYGGENDVEAIIEEALKAFENSEFDRAIELCGKVLSINPKHIKAMEIRASSNSRLGKYDEAIKQFDIILQKEPKNIGALEEKGLAFLNKNDYDATYNTFELLTKLEPDNIIAWHSMGEALFHRDSFDEAIKCFDKAIRINPHNDSSWVMKAKALSKKGDHQDAINCLDEALQHAVNKSYILLEKGIVYREMGKKNEEFHCYDQAIEHNPKYTQASIQKAFSLSQDNDFEGAIDCFKKAIDNDLKPKQEAILWHNLAVTYLGIHNYEEAYRSINRSLELYDNEHTRMVRDAIEKDMSLVGAGNKTDGENVDQLVKEVATGQKKVLAKFKEFLVREKGVPANGIKEERVWVDVIRRVDLDVLFIREGDKTLAVIEYYFESGLRQIERENRILQKYKEQEKLEGCPAYIACLAPSEGERLVDIYQVTVGEEPVYISNEEFPTYEELKQKTAGKKLTISNFKVMLDVDGSKICDKVIEIAKSSNSGLDIEITDESYINLRSTGAERKTANVVIQIHRYGEPDTRIALAVAGIKTGATVSTKPKLNDYITKGVMSLLSGYEKGIAGEIAWLNGNLPVKGTREKASVYVIEREIVNNPEAWNGVEELFEWAVENFDKTPTKELDKTQTIGNVATMADDKASVKDLLGRTGLVEALANMFVHSKEMEGFTVALFGNWGEGKSTMMKLLEKHLEKHHRKRFVFAKFNAWEYEKTDNIAAGLALEVVKGLKESFNLLCRITLYICFIAKEHWYRFIWWVTKFGLAVLPFILLYFFRGQLGLTEQQDRIINDLLGISLAGVGSIVIGFYVLKNFKHIVEHPLVTNLETFLKLPNYGKHLGLVPVLKRHIGILCDLSLKAGVWKWRWGKDRKLIVFVDDLDRCQPKCIAETLDAIRLVMENQNVIVFIGIDHRIAFKAIEEHYHKVENGNGGRRKGEIARDYLGKIIQLPIRLQEPTVQGLGEFINERLFPNVVESPSRDEESDTERQSQQQEYSKVDQKEFGDTEGEKTPPTSDSGKRPQTIYTEIAEEEMRDTEDERDEFHSMAKKFGFSNPRQLLRLRNCYRLIKALELQKARKKNQELGFEKLKSFMRMLFWQEFLHNRPKCLRQACVKSLYEDIDAEKISDEQTKVIIKQVKGLIIESFTDKKIYDETAEDVRIVVLPHSQED